MQGHKQIHKSRGNYSTFLKQSFDSTFNSYEIDIEISILEREGDTFLLVPRDKREFNDF